ncbi:MAG: hypothetical protein ACI9FG_001023 [Crocinitomicaceae bacterium]|jgi:hypothetical protein
MGRSHGTYDQEVAGRVMPSYPPFSPRHLTLKSKFLATNNHDQNTILAQYITFSRQLRQQ